jgi:hypothetical protein
MNILSKIWSWIKTIFAALNKEPENSVLDVGIPADPNGADDASTDETPVEPETDNTHSN